MVPGPGSGIPWFAYSPEVESEDFLVVPADESDPEKFVACAGTLAIAIEKAQGWSAKNGKPCRVVRLAYSAVAKVGEEVTA